jgi:hypothetical protein
LRNSNVAQSESPAPQASVTHVATARNGSDSPQPAAKNFNSTGSSESGATAASTSASSAHRWALPNQTQAKTHSQSPASAAAANAGTESGAPRPFAPAANAAKLPTANERAAQSHTVSTQRAPTTGPVDHQVLVTSGSTTSRAVAQNRIYSGRPRVAQRPMHKQRSYTGRLWDSVNVAFQAQQWDAPVEPESLPMPGETIHMDGAHGDMGHMHGPYEMSMDGCADGSCSTYGGCGCGQMGCAGGCGSGMCGCGDGVGCGEMCEPGCGCEPSCGCGSGSCGNGCVCDGLCLGFGDHESCHTIRVRVPKWQELSIWGGVHGFKGPYDQERDGGNFGFHEGINAGFKVPFTTMGYQIGYQAVHSQLNGDENTDESDSHTQHFVTVGMFQRARDGLQGGVAWDMLRDERFNSVDFHQLRGELSFIDRGCHELGVAVAVHLNEHEILVPQDSGSSHFYQASDQYLLFYRFHGKNGGEGRFYGGWNDDSDGLVGADMLLPLSDRWSLMANFAYLIPEEGGGSEGASQEAWNVSTGLVWHWDCRARRSHSNCYRPLFNVADNGYLIIDEHPGAAPQEVSGGVAPPPDGSGN